MSLRTPSLFLSSTFYDLKAVRADVGRFIEEELGYRLVASEYDSFPVDPQVDAVENCRRRVQDNADVLVLLLGVRYGSVPAGLTRSVTNMEFAAARAKQLPVYAFVHKDLVAALRLHETNSTDAATVAVDNPQIFEFLAEVRGSKGVWTFEFDSAADIVTTLRAQLAYQMGRGLRLSARMLSTDGFLAGLHGEPFRIAVDQVDGWEASLFVAIIEQEIATADYQRRDHELAIALGPGEVLTADSITAWLVAATNEPLRIVRAAEVVAAEAITHGFSNNDVTAIIYGAKRFGDMYREAFSWAARLRRAHVPSRWKRAVEALARLLDRFIVECRAFVPRAKEEIAKALAAEQDGTVKIKLSFKVDVDNTEVLAEMERLRKGGV